MAAGIHYLKAVNTQASPLVLTAAVSTVATVYSIYNRENHAPAFARASSGSWITVPPRRTINVAVPNGDTLDLATNGEANRRWISAATERQAPEAPVTVQVSVVHID